MSIAALVTALGGTPAEADKVAELIGSMPVLPRPSQEIALVKETLDLIRSAK